MVLILRGGEPSAWQANVSYCCFPILFIAVAESHLLHALQVTQIMVPLLKFYFHEEVRQAAVQAMPELLKSLYLAVSEGKANGRDMQYVKQMLDYVWQPLIDSMVKVSLRSALSCVACLT